MKKILRFAKMGDVFILNTRCKLNDSIKNAFQEKGYTVKISELNKDPSETLKEAKGFTAVCLFVNKVITKSQVDILKDNDNKLVLHCSAGYDNSPTEELRAAGIRVANVPKYSPASIAEYAITQIMALCKNTHKSYVMTKKADFDITSLECLLLENKICGIIGTGIIGRKTVEKISGLVEKVYCYDVYPNKEWISGIKNAEYVDMNTLLKSSDFISIHVPLLPDTRHLINEEAFAMMKKDAVLVNTSRGEIVHLPSLIKALEENKLWGVALDVFEGEKKYIFHDKSADGFKDDPDLAKLTTFDNVKLSSHIAFYTDQAIEQITSKTLKNYEGFLGKGPLDKKAFIV